MTSVQIRELPALDINRYRDALEANGGEVYDDEIDVHMAEAARADYFRDALGLAFRIRELQGELYRSSDQKKNGDRERKLERCVGILPAYLIQTEVFFNLANAEFLRNALGEEAGFQFDEEYRLTAASIEAPIYTKQENEPMSAKTPLKRKASAKTAKAAKTVRTKPARATKRTAKPKPVKLVDASASRPLGEVKEIPLGKVRVSPFETQKRRRARFIDAETTSLAQDIGMNGLNQAILVRQVKDKFEIVFGERRFLAVGKLGRVKIRAEIRKLTDEEAFDIQQSENREREPQHPVDEGFAYKIMKDKFGHDDAEIAVRVGETESYVSSRLKLMDLAAVVLKAFEENRILLGHALEIAKHPRDLHQELLDRCFSQGGTYDSGLLSVRQLIARIESELLHRLDKAPFPIKADFLRDDKLPCTSCPQRTGASPLLFAEDYNPKDQCLNAVCWNAKTINFIEIQRKRIAMPNYTPGEKIDNEQLKAAEAVPFLAKDYVHHGEYEPENYIDRHDYTEVKSDKDCKNATWGVFFNGDRVGQKALVCFEKKCPKHAGRYMSTSARKADPEAAREERMRRKEELIDIRVGEVVRKRVFKEAAEKFGDGFTVAEPVYGDELLPELAMWAYEQCGGEHTNHVVLPIVDQWNPEEHSPGTGYGVRHDSLEQFKETFDDITMRRLLFLCLNADKGAMYYDSYSSQVEVRELADKFTVDYRLIDAEERLKLSMEKYKKVVEDYRQYLEAVKAGNAEATIPRPFFASYTPKY